MMMKMKWKFVFLMGLGALACAAGAVAPSVTQAQARTPIQHVVIIYLENHSFDNVLGYWCNGHPGRCPNGGMPSKVALSDGTVVTPTVDPDTVPPASHNVAAQLAAMNGGKMNGWENIPASPSPQDGCGAATNYHCISGYMPTQIPNLTTLANHFAISDMTFSMGDSPSWGGHLYAVAASLGGFLGNNPVPKAGVTPGSGWGCDSDKVTTWRDSKGTQHWNIPSCVPDPALSLPNGGAFEPTPVKYIPTIMDRLGPQGLSWKIYGGMYGQDGYIWSICPTFAECLYTQQHRHLVPDSQFLTDATAGALPAFSVVVPGGPDTLNACHNYDSMTACDNWVGHLASAVEKSPDWSSTAVFITFDDCGCFYDQVPPPRNPDGTQEGPRVPLIIVSPYAKPGYTDIAATSFAGILSYTEHNFGLRPLGVNDAQAYPFTNAFNYSQAPLRPAPMVTQRLPTSARHSHLTKGEMNDPT
jgi:phospholipase C